MLTMGEAMGTPGVYEVYLNESDTAPDPGSCLTVDNSGGALLSGPASKYGEGVEKEAAMAHQALWTYRYIRTQGG